MNPILSAGILIGVLCGVWTFLMRFTGWYRDAAMLSALSFVFLEIGGLIWGLRRTALEARTYRGQIVAGTLMAVVAGVIIIGSSLIAATPMADAMSDFTGTLVTGILASAVIAIWVRNKEQHGTAV